jgi:hypothetical protein
MEEWNKGDLIEVKNDWKKLAYDLAEKVERYEKALKDISELDLYRITSIAMARSIAEEALD